MNAIAEEIISAVKKNNPHFTESEIYSAAINVHAGLGEYIASKEGITTGIRRPIRTRIINAIIRDVKAANPAIADEAIIDAIAEIQSDSGRPIIDFLKGIDWAKLIELILKIIG